MHILADQNIPHVDAAFQALGTVTTLPGHAIGPDEVAGAEVLLVRSVTAVDEALLRAKRASGSTLAFVGSATIGTDHVDQALLRDRGVAFAHAPGSNAESVVEYVVTGLLALHEREGLSHAGRTVGIIGVGQIGSRLAVRLEALGFRVLLNDPPRQENEPDQPFVRLDALLEESDIVTLHVPLTSDGPYPTRGFVDDQFLKRLQPGTWLVNSCRGGVVESEALRTHRDQLGSLILDVWPNEPTPLPALIDAADIATPHIAGYSFDGKLNGTLMLHEALCDVLGQPPRWSGEAERRPGSPLIAYTPPADLPETARLSRLAQQAYPIWRDDAQFRTTLCRASSPAAGFRELRKTYPRRRAFGLWSVEDAGLAEKLGFEGGQTRSRALG
ncbi:MAG: 4-phosphoerythronate dehydrogenase [Bacteroidota bacterium]